MYIKYVTVCSRIGTTFLNTGIYLQQENASYPLPQKQFAIFEDRDWYPNRLGLLWDCAVRNGGKRKFLILEWFSQAI